MRNWTQNVLLSLPTAIVVEIVLQGILQSFPFDNAPLVDGVNEISPIVADLLPWILYGISVLYALVILTYVYRWVFDIWKGGPKRRAFSALCSDIQQCKYLLIQSNRPIAHISIDETEAYSNIITAASRLSKLRDDLCKIGITFPTSHINEPDNRKTLVGFLSALEVYANSGDFEGAQEAVRDLQKLVK